MKQSITKSTSSWKITWQFLSRSVSTTINATKSSSSTRIIFTSIIIIISIAPLTWIINCKTSTVEWATNKVHLTNVKTNTHTNNNKNNSNINSHSSLLSSTEYWVLSEVSEQIRTDQIKLDFWVYYLSLIISYVMR